MRSLRCPACTLTLPQADYYRSSRTATGRRVYCKECIRRQNQRNYQARKAARLSVAAS